VELTHGFQHALAFGPLSAGTAERRFRIGQRPFSSYEVVVDSTSGDVGPGLALERLSSDGVTVLQSSVPLGAVGFSRSLRWTNPSAASIGNEFVRVRSSSCTVATCGPEDVFRVLAYDTTYVAPRFNNSATQVTVLLVQNPTQHPVTGTAYFWKADGTPAGSQGFSLGLEGLLVLNTAAVPGVAGQSGSITIVNDGRYGELLGKTIAVEPATGFTFDTPLASRPR